ncbi:hypothetical protein BPUTSESOX_176 [uncultured Gammaproteobacteria bacterium]|nr:hypothetical protein BPUTSESOX_176 [uncultured Gammaproteobacteria bacterium]
MRIIDIQNLKVNDIIRKCVHCKFCLAILFNLSTGWVMN